GGCGTRVSRGQEVHPLSLRDVPAAGRDARPAARAGAQRGGDRGDAARRDGRSLRQRWFGATRKQVPQLAVEGEIEFPAEPLVLDELDDALLRKAHDEGTPVVVRADTEEKVLAALARPEVACVLVPSRELLEI